MNLDELRTVQSKERQKDSLQHLRPSFYKEVGEYIANLEDERERVAEAVDDPFSSPEVGRLTDEIETAKDVVEAIYERRMGKLVKQASLAAAGMPADDEGLTAEESDLFTDLVDRIQGNKQRVLDVLDGNEDAVAEAAASSESTVPDPSADPGDALADVAGSASDESTADPSSEGSVSVADAMGGDLPSSNDADAVDAAEAGTTSGVGGAGDDVPPPPPDEPPADREDANDAEPGAETTGGEGSSDVAPDVDRVTVRITRDVGSILGIDDREYTLATDDVVTLPEQNATPLVEREAAEPLE
ncbi:hypothetical protein [Natronosalvus rutilus]|uniref:GINS subunit domain-containing protein n=1 Tax=Natronosalvus rutilus TaxID=2953753 RepID=A0A9E7NCZ9_9EURY|nr:hypothetical protein [Natronosalvus rutilus]UTF55131.1 hypothetical protein NGM29_07735 [Natronosalvus rutilus]